MKMKATLSVICCFVISGFFGLQALGQDADEIIKQQKKVYQLAIEMSDGNAAQQAVMNIIAADEKQSEWLDTLAYLYFNTGSYGNCILASRKILSADEKKYGVLEIKAISEKNIGLYKESLASYETLQKAKPDINYLYEIATIQFQMKRYGECEATVGKILSSEQVDKETVTIQAQKIRPQKVKMRAAVLNMMGVLAAEMNKLEDATKFYSKALEVQEDFALAQLNLQVMKKAAEKANTEEKPSAK